MLTRPAASSRVSSAAFARAAASLAAPERALEGRLRLRGQVVPAQFEAVRAGQRDDRRQARLVGRGAGRVVTAEAHPEQPGLLPVHVLASPQVVHRGGGHLLVSGLDRQLVLGFALARAVDRASWRGRGPDQYSAVACSSSLVESRPGTMITTGGLGRPGTRRYAGSSVPA